MLDGVVVASVSAAEVIWRLSLLLMHAQRQVFRALPLLLRLLLLLKWPLPLTLPLPLPLPLPLLLTWP